MKNNPFFGVKWMGRDWISTTELKLPKKCPNCGSTRFHIEGARKIIFESIYRMTDKGVKVEEDHNTDSEWEVAYSVCCAECHEELSDLVGL